MGCSYRIRWFYIAVPQGLHSISDFHHIERCYYDSKHYQEDSVESTPHTLYCSSGLVYRTVFSMTDHQSSVKDHNLKQVHRSRAVDNHDVICWSW